MTDNIIPSLIRHPGELAQFPLNSNSHPDCQIDELAASRDRFNQYRNIVVWTCPNDIETQDASGKPIILRRGITYVLAGNGFHLASIKRGDESIEVKDYSHLSLDEAILLTETDNAAPLGAERMVEQLRANLERAKSLYVDDERMSRMLERLRQQTGLNGGNGKGQDAEPPVLTDRAEELQAKWQVKPGDLFEFESNATPGRFHRLLCGDCRNPDDIARLMDGQKANGIFTSPPYAEQRKRQYGGVRTAEYVEWWEAVQTNVRSVLAEDGSFFVNIKPHTEDGQRVLYAFDLVCAMVRQWAWRFVDEFCWERAGMIGSPDNMGRFKNQFEPIYWFTVSDIYKFFPANVMHKTDNAILDDNYKPGLDRTQGQGGNSVLGDRLKGDGLAYPGNRLRIGNADALGHAAAFPVALPTFFLRAYSDPGDSWLDPFAGSGTVAIAAEREGRLTFMTEVLPKYCAVICERLDATGLHPHRLSG